MLLFHWNIGGSKGAALPLQTKCFLSFWGWGNFGNNKKLAPPRRGNPGPVYLKLVQVKIISRPNCKNFIFWSLLNVLWLCAAPMTGFFLCFLHWPWTLWTVFFCRFLSVYVFMGTLQSWNTQKWKMTAKFVVYAAFNALIFDIPG